MKSLGITSILFLLSLSPIVSFAKSDPNGFVGNIDAMTTANENFRKVIYTGEKLQLVLMNLKPGEEIGEEIHQDIDQFFRIEEGSGEVMINGKKSLVKKDDAFLVPAGSKHNVTNTGKGPLKLYTIYGPPKHKDETVQKNRPL